MALTIQERLKDLRVEWGLTLEQLANETGLSKSALGSYESEDYKDISHHAINRLADFYGVTADYLLARTETKSHPNAELSDLHLSDEMIELLKSNGWIRHCFVNWQPTRISQSFLLTYRYMWKGLHPCKYRT